MPFQSTGTPETQRLVFNTGYITIDSDSIIDLSDITVNESYTEKSFYALNSIKKRAIRRSEYNAEISFTTMSDSEKLKEYFYSSQSEVVTGEVDYNPKDGQQNAISSFLITGFTDVAETKGYQLTIENPTILTFNRAPSSQEFQSFEVTIACTDISKVKVITA